MNADTIACRARLAANPPRRQDRQRLDASVTPSIYWTQRYTKSPGTLKGVGFLDSAVLWREAATAIPALSKALSSRPSTKRESLATSGGAWAG